MGGALNDAAAAAAEADMSRSAGDVGDWLGVDSGAPAAAAVQVALAGSGPACWGPTSLLCNNSTEPELAAKLPTTCLPVPKACVL